MTKKDAAISDDALSAIAAAGGSLMSFEDYVKQKYGKGLHELKAQDIRKYSHMYSDFIYDMGYEDGAEHKPSKSTPHIIPWTRK